MKIEKFAIGDYFYTAIELDRSFVQVKDIRCAFNPAHNRWETEVIYDEVVQGFAEPKLVMKAADFVRMIQEPRFVRHFRSFAPLPERQRGKCF